MKSIIIMVFFLLGMSGGMVPGLKIPTCAVVNKLLYLLGGHNSINILSHDVYALELNKKWELSPGGVAPFLKKGNIDPQIRLYEDYKSVTHKDMIYYTTV